MINDPGQDQIASTVADAHDAGTADRADPPDEGEEAPEAALLRLIVEIDADAPYERVARREVLLRWRDATISSGLSGECRAGLYGLIGCALDFLNSAECGTWPNEAMSAFLEQRTLLEHIEHVACARANVYGLTEEDGDGDARAILAILAAPIDQIAAALIGAPSVNEDVLGGIVDRLQDEINDRRSARRARPGVAA